MKDFYLSRYLKRWLPLILVVCMVFTCATYALLSLTQSYEASAVIEYTSEDARLGLTPSGEKLEVAELKSASVIAKVIDRLDLSETYSADRLISGISILALPDEEEEAIKEAKWELGEEYISEPIRYIVSYTDKDPVKARQILDEVLDVYFEEYSSRYVNTSTLSNRLNKIYNDNYDYLELMELVESDVELAVSVLYGRQSKAPYFRSADTGLTFQDLIYEFEYLLNVSVSEIYSEIYGYQITRNKDVLVATYNARMDANGITGQVELDMIEDVEHLIDAYVEHMAASGNTDITHEYILDQVYDPDHHDYQGNLIGSGEQTVTYDKLMDAWREHRQSKDHAAIDTAYCNWVIGSFTACTGNCDNRCESSALTCTALSNASYADMEARVNTQVRQLVDKLNELYVLTAKTNTEYNAYLGAGNISVLSSVSGYESVNVMLYTAIVAVLLLIVGFGTAVVLGRMEDILSFMFRTDHLTGFGNRAAVDNYLTKQENKVLKDHTVCTMVMIKNQPQINQQLGRKGGDELLACFSQSMKEAFSGYDAEFFYNGNASFIVFCNKMSADEARDCTRQISLLVDRREAAAQCDVQYEIGIAESKRDDAYETRKLLTKAYDNRESFVSVTAER